MTATDRTLKLKISAFASEMGRSVMICAINYSGRASELGSIINLVDRIGPVYHALSVHLSPATGILITRFEIDMLRQNFLSPQFGAKFQREVPLFFHVPK